MSGAANRGARRKAVRCGRAILVLGPSRHSFVAAAAGAPFTVKKLECLKQASPLGYISME
jgi:hypothetical protein